MAQVDFVPATLSALEDRGRYLAVVFPKQPLITSQLGDDIDVTWHYCEIQITDGKLVAEHPLALPMRIENIEVRHSDGGHGCHLPVGFEATGPVKLQVEILRGSEYVRETIAVGSAVRLYLQENHIG